MANWYTTIRRVGHLWGAWKSRLGAFEAFVAEDPEAPNFPVEAGQGYLALVPSAGSRTVRGMSQTESVGVRAGVNMVSLPLRPSEPLHARDLADRLGGTTVIRYDASVGRFVPFIPDFNQGEGFALEGGAGYLLVASRDTTVAFPGVGWRGEQGAPPLTAKETSVTGRSVFGLTGTLCHLIGEEVLPVTDPCGLLLRNRRTGTALESRTSRGSGRFSTAFVDIQNTGPWAKGDTLELSTLDAGGRPNGEPNLYVLGEEDIAKGYHLYGRVTLNMLPTVTRVELGAPNPFAQSTTIRYQLAAPGKVRLKIYAVDGRAVKTLVDAQMRPGYYQAIWDGSTNAGKRAAAGVYFYRFDAPGCLSTRKLVVLK